MYITIVSFVTWICPLCLFGIALITSLASWFSAPICILFYVCVCLFYFGLCFYHFWLILFLIVLPASIKPLSKFRVFVLLFDARFLCFILFLFTPFQSIHLACIYIHFQPNISPQYISIFWLSNCNYTWRHTSTSASLIKLWKRKWRTFVCFVPVGPCWVILVTMLAQTLKYPGCLIWMI